VSLVEMILDQKLILLSIGLAIAPLLAAATLIVVSRMRKNADRRARAKRAQAAARQAVIASAQQAAASPAPDASVRVESKPPVAIQSSAVPVKTGPVQPEQPQEQPSEDATEQAVPESPEMQDILSSVFAEDDVSTHYGALLEGLDEVDTSELVTLCNQIAHCMRAGSAPAAQD
jgi:type II secretory pathway pseudopilin PulG